jgi:hypothetical protein
LQRFVGLPYDEELVEKFKRERFFINDFVSDERGLISWKIQKSFPNGTTVDEILFTEEIVGMLFKHGRQLSEK